MIALPEIETIRRDLDRELSGLQVKSVEVANARPVARSGGAKGLAKRLEKVKITGVRRRGLYLIMHLNSDDVMVAHLGKGGQLRRHANKDALEPNTAVVITFSEKGQVRLVDHGGEAEMFVVNTEKLGEEVPQLNELGMDPLDHPVAWREFGNTLLKQNVKLKAVLTDERVIVGLGEMYSDEILFAAGLRYDRMTSSLGPQEIRRLYRSVVEVLHEATKHRGSTLEGSSYRDVFGEPGGYEEYINVFKQAGKSGHPCPRCHRPIQKFRYRRRWTFYCEQCQI